MDKTEIRRRMRQLNRTLLPEQRRAVSEELFRAVEAVEAFQKAHVVAAYCALPDEPETEAALLRWVEAGKRVAVPRVEGETMRFFYYDTACLQAGAFGIMEPGPEAMCCPPEAMDVMIVPGVAFTASGERMGRGRGYYDKYLVQSDFRAYTIGVGYAHQLLAMLPTEEHDVRLDKVIVR